DLLTTVALATPAPVAVAPAMNQQMWANEATQDNLRQLVGRGIQIIGPDAGEQACGDVGPGRLLEPDAIASALAENFESRLLEGKHVVITAGPTVEAIDPVRYLSNHSSGKMGYALARACADAGARVTLITGPVTLTPPNRVDRVPVTSAIEMHDAALRCASNADIFIGAAAVADYRPESSAPEKLKKTAGENRVISLVQNPDIVAAVAALAQRPALVIGFAAETTELIAHAREKRHRKGLDYIVANDVSDPETTFGSDQNAVHLISEHEAHYLPLATKQVIAERIISLVAHHLGSTSPASG
ncbi:bifunctional phosphopantothenoylcysteine decarboxylase/phosphopantothenate--cysteine ligase CoaBC, partial [Luminiphilus sp.]|nr:bifunctional phosphopantothenoylcysteine decarboxylase/phosphopantothenate--cysteine ligase CoaBC [Luminiphilus sp.]